MSLLLIIGAETALADRALSKVLEELREEKAEITNIFGGEAEVGDIAEAVAPSLFSEKRALIIRDLQDLPTECQNEITSYLADVDPTMSVVFVHKGGIKGKAIVDQIKKAKADVISCDVLKKDSEKQDFIRNLFLDLGRKATPGAVTALLSALGNDMRELSAACSQIASDTVGLIDEEVINRYHQGRIETTGFDVASAALDGDLSQALLALRSAIATGTDPVMVTSAMASALRGLAKVSGTNSGSKSFELAGPLGMAPWQIDKARRQLNSWSPQGISKAVQAVALADAQVKGAAVDPIFALEQAITKISRARS
ncbi:MAG: DNA polymerase III subunit delta [Actinomycetota bacterium]